MFGYESKNDYVFGSVCHSNEMHSSFETGDHLKIFGLHWSLLHRALKKMRKCENLWEKLPYSEGDLCSYGGFGGHDIQDKKVP